MPELASHSVGAAPVSPKPVALSRFEPGPTRGLFEFLPAVCEPAFEFVGAVSQFGVGLAELGLVLGWVGLGGELILFAVGAAVLFGCLSGAAFRLVFSQTHFELLTNLNLLLTVSF